MTDDIDAKVSARMDTALATQMAAHERLAWTALAKSDWASFAASANRWAALKGAHSAHIPSPFRVLAKLAQAHLATQGSKSK